MPNIGDNISYNATYTPGNATLPVTYSWSISPVTAGVITPNSNSASINVQWNETGNHNLQLNTTNCGGTQSHSQTISVVAAPSPATPVAPSPIAPSPVTPSPIAPSPAAPSPVYNKCALTINWNTPSVICNGDNTSTITVSVNGNNGETVEFSVAGGAYQTANSSTNIFIHNVPSNGNSIGFRARIVGCTTEINGIVNACTVAPSPVAPTAPSPSPTTPVAPSPVAPSPVAPSPIYDKCALNIYWNTPNVTCNGDNTSTIEVSVDGDNGELIEFSVSGNPYSPANMGNSGYIHNVPSNGNTIGFDARVVGCTNSINGTVQACVAAPSPVAPSPSPATPVAPSPIAPSPTAPPTVSCIPITGMTMSGNFNQRLGDTETYTMSINPSGFSTPVIYNWILGSGGTIISGQGTNTIDVLWTAYGSDGHHLLVAEVTDACGNFFFSSNNTTLCIPITGFDFRVGLATNPSNMTISLGDVKDIDIANIVPSGPGIGSVTFRIGIYDTNNAQLYLSGFSTEGSPINYQFNDPAATKLVVGVYSGCEYLASEVALNIV